MRLWVTGAWPNIWRRTPSRLVGPATLETLLFPTAPRTCTPADLDPLPVMPNTPQLLGVGTLRTFPGRPG